MRPPDPEDQRSFRRGTFQELKPGLPDEVGHVNPGHGVVREQTHDTPVRRLQGPPQAQGGNRAVMPPGVNDDVAGIAGHGRGERISPSLSGAPAIRSSRG